MQDLRSDHTHALRRRPGFRIVPASGACRWCGNGPAGHDGRVARRTAGASAGSQHVGELAEWMAPVARRAPRVYQHRSTLIAEPYHHGVDRFLDAMSVALAIVATLGLLMILTGAL